MKCSAFHLLPVLFLLLSFVIPFSGVAEVLVSGYVYCLTESGEYKTLPGVEIQAYREGPILAKPVVTSRDGSFKFAVKPGTPFQVHFCGENRVPELQLLAGKDGTDNRVHIALSSAELAKRRPEVLGMKLQAIISQLPEKDAFWARAEQLLREIGDIPHRGAVGPPESLRPNTGGDNQPGEVPLGTDLPTEKEPLPAQTRVP